MEASLYRPLDVNTIEIRRLSVVRDGVSGAVQCGLQYFPLLASPAYVALSYAWREPSLGKGSASSKEIVLVDSQDFLVTINLALALKTLRVETAFIWVDALCIDQSNTPERSAQVSIMRMIYERAQKVVVWLGPEKDESTVALDFIELVAEQSAKPNFPIWLMNTVKSKLHVHGWTAFQKLFERDWWTCTWALQQFVLGKKVDFVCSQRTMAAEKLEKALEHAYHYDLSLSKLLRDRHPISLHTRRDGKSLPLLPVLNIVIWTSCSDPRDKVYGILGIVTDPGIARISPDYSLPSHEVYRRLVRNHIESDLTLDILGFVKPSNVTEGLPSLVPDWNATSRTTYCADKSTAAITSFSSDSTVLVCRGAFIDAVDGVSVANVPDSQLDIDEIQSTSSASAYGSDVDMFDAVWRTFIGNATYPEEPDIRAPLNFRPLFVQKCLKAEADLTAATHDGPGQLPTAGVSKTLSERDIVTYGVAGLQGGL